MIWTIIITVALLALLWCSDSCEGQLTAMICTPVFGIVLLIVFVIGCSEIHKGKYDNVAELRRSNQDESVQAAIDKAMADDCITEIEYSDIFRTVDDAALARAKAEVIPPTKVGH